ncbi:MAG: hypothetical protein AAFV54_00460 [Pseudomonadota bacterium]
MPIHKPHWFSDKTVMVSTAPTCGLSKGGRLLKRIDAETGNYIQTKDPETGALVDAVNDRLLEDMEVLDQLASKPSTPLPETLSFVPVENIDLGCAVPLYYDHRFTDYFREAIAHDSTFKGFTYATLGKLQEEGKIIIRGGHGSPSQEQRIGDVPYIKVSDLRAGHVNINPTNRVPQVVAERFWRGQDSGLHAFDLICPERTSKNIGDFCVLMPGQEQVLMTKEMIVLRAADDANFDQFYLLWAMTLKIVRDQWKRVVFMQTNREDVGKRYLEILVPVPPNEERGMTVSEAFRNYYNTIAAARINLEIYLASDKRHHFFVSGAEAAVAESDEDQA